MVEFRAIAFDQVAPVLDHLDRQRLAGRCIERLDDTQDCRQQPDVPDLQRAGSRPARPAMNASTIMHGLRDQQQAAARHPIDDRPAGSIRNSVGIVPMNEIAPSASSEPVSW